MGMVYRKMRTWRGCGSARLQNRDMLRLDKNWRLTKGGRKETTEEGREEWVVIKRKCNY